jgi:hypothetical protein
MVATIISVLAAITALINLSALANLYGSPLLDRKRLTKRNVRSHQGPWRFSSSPLA